MTTFKKTASVSSQDELNADGHPQKKGNPGRKAVGGYHRDSLMAGLGKKYKYKKYNWEKNKGYGTKEHRKLIRKYGITRYRRKQFVATWLSKN
jgi:hypothetical protein